MLQREIKNIELRHSQLREALLQKAGITKELIFAIQEARNDYNEEVKRAREAFYRRIKKAEEEYNNRLNRLLQNLNINKRILKLYKEEYLKIIPEEIYNLLINNVK